jgi:hypothetical protein
VSYFVKLPNGYVNLDHLTKIEQQVGGAYRLRWSDGMVNVIPSDEGDTIVEAIEHTTNQILESAREKATEIFKDEQAELEKSKPARKRKTPSKT